MAGKTMTNMKICPLCKKENSDDAAICINCGFDLNPTFTADHQEHSDWLSSFRSDSEEKVTPANHEDLGQTQIEDLDNDSPDWLARIRDRKQIDHEFETLQNIDYVDKKKTANSKNTDELVDSFRMDNVDQINNKDDSNDLISILRDAQDDDFLGDQTDQSTFPDMNDGGEKDDLPINEDWIARFTQTSDAAAPELSESAARDPKRIPDWVQENENARIDTPENKDEQKSPFADWVEKFGSQEDLGSESNAVKGLPDWIQASEEIREPETEEHIPTPQSKVNGEAIDRKNLGESEVSHVPGWVNEIDKKASLSEELHGDEILPDWMTDESIQVDSKGEPALIADESTEESPISSTLMGEQSQNQIITGSSKTKKNAHNKRKIEKPETSETKPQPPAELAAPPFQLDQVPSWLENNEDLINTGFFEDKEVKETTFSESNNSIEPGELPSWLKAMRPLEAIVPAVSGSVEKKQVERSGPLAGLKGVLSSQDSSQVYSPPPMYATILNITDKQKIQAEILDKLFIEEKVSQTNAEHVKINWLDLSLRILMPIILIGCIVYALLLNSGSTPRPAIFPAETVRFASLVNGLILNTESPPNILVIMESDGASQAELSLLTKNVFERLMVKGSYISIISTSPNGALLASNLIENTALQMSSYDVSAKVTNLGFLAGSSTGMQNFLINPRWTMPSGIGNTAVWESEGLSGLQNISQFSGILLITDNNENSKYWLEQLQMFSPDSIVLVAATTQSIPMLKPYVESSQIDGMIGGLYGGASYAELNQTENAEIWKFWEIQKFVIYIFILIIIAGGLLFLVQLLFKKPSGENVTK